MRNTFPAALALAATLVATAAQAHAHLVEASPKAGSAAGAPGELRLKFSEDLVGRFSTFTLSGPGGNVPVKVAATQAALVGTPVKLLPPGAYTVKWRVVSTDTHHSQGQYGFTVR